MTSADRRRAHLRVGAATVGVFLLLLALGAGHRAAASGGAAPASTLQPAQPTVPRGQFPPYGGHRGFEPGDGPDRDGDGGFRGGPPAGGAPAAPGGDGGLQS